MDPLTLIVTAIVAGAALGAKDIANKAVHDAYASLKHLVIRKYGDTADIVDAIARVETNPDSKGRQIALQEDLQAAGVDQNSKVLKKAKAVHKACKKAGPQAVTYYNAVLTGSGAIAQGGGVAAGAGGIAVGGSVHGPVVKGSRNILGDVQGDVDLSEVKLSQTGKYITNIDEAQGTVLGDGAQVNQHFNDGDD